MTTIVLSNFKAEVPRFAPELLNPEFAEDAINCKLERGELSAYEGATAVLTVSSSVQTIYLWADAFWFRWNTDVNAVKGPIAQDTSERTYFTGDGAPKMTYSPIATSGGSAYPINSYTLGIPAPLTAPTTAASNPAKTISGATKASPAVLTITAHGFASGTYINVTGVGGMTELNGRTFKVAVLSADSVAIYDSITNLPIDSTTYTTYTSGGTATVNAVLAPLEEREDRSYAYTYVSALGEEGAPSSPSAILSISPGQQVTVSNMLTGPTGGTYNVTLKRLYRLVDSADGAAYQFVVELPVGTTSYADTLTDSQLGEVLPTLVNDPPPSDMAGLIALPNAVLAGFSKNQLCLSVPGMPHAWPTIYRKTFHDNIVAISNFGTSIVIATKKDVFLGNGSDPQSVSIVELELKQGCASKRSMVSIGLSGVVFASPDGLVRVSGNDASLVTDSIMTRDDWQALVPSSIAGYYHDGLYYGFYDTGSVTGGFIIDPLNPGNGITFITGLYAKAGFQDPLTDTLYLLFGTSISKWDDNAAAPLTYRWRSKKFDTSRECNLAVAEVHARTYANLTLRLFADQGNETLEQVDSVAVTTRDPFYLVDLELSNTFQVELEGTDRVYKVMLAETMEELKAAA